VSSSSSAVVPRGGASRGGDALAAASAAGALASPPTVPAAGAAPALGGLSNIIQSSGGLSHVQAHDRYGFKVNGIHMRGSVIVFDSFTLLWNVQRVAQIAPRNAAVVHMVRPKVELLLVGTGARMRNINPSLYGYFQRKGVAVEPMSTVSGRRSDASPVLRGPPRGPRQVKKGRSLAPRRPLHPRSFTPHTPHTARTHRCTPSLPSTRSTRRAGAWR
jgi:uncharacterized protein